MRLRQTTSTDPGYVPIRASAWPTRRAPRWMIGAGVALAAVAVAIAIPHHPTAGQRATDLRSFMRMLNSDVESCAGGVRESLYVLHQLDAGASHDVATALSVAKVGAANCLPSNNSLIDDLTSAQVPESLRSFHLEASITDLINWAAPDASQVQADIAIVLADRGKPAEAAARAALHQALVKLDAQRATFYAALRPAIKALSPQSAPPRLWG